MRPIPDNPHQRLRSGPTIRRYFGIEDLHFIGAAFCPGSPGYSLTIALIDGDGRIAGMGKADQPCGRKGLPRRCGFRIPIPLAWQGRPEKDLRFVFRILETGVEFPCGGRTLPRKRLNGRSTEPAGPTTAEVLRDLARVVAGLTEVADPYLLVIHESQRTGAPLIALSVARSLTRDRGWTPVTICLGEEGPVFREFAALGPAVAGAGSMPTVVGRPREVWLDLLRTLRSHTRHRALVNSLCSGPIVSDLTESGYELVTLVHEYPFAFSSKSIRALIQRSVEIVFPCSDVRRMFDPYCRNHRGGIHVRPQGAYALPPGGLAPSSSRVWKDELGLGSGALVVMACGTADLRKGFDWFCDFALDFLRHSPLAGRTHFVWLGKPADPALVFHALLPLDQSGWRKHFHLLPERPDAVSVLAGADVMLMCSRIDPFPSVVLESLACGVPVVAFDQGQGCAQMLEATGFGEVVPARDLTAARCAVEALTEDGERREWIREMAPTWVRTMFSVPDYAAFIGRLIENKDAAAHQTWPVPDWAGSVRALSCGWGSPTWKLRLRDDLRGLRRAIARGENPHSWMFPWGELRFQRADTIPSQIEDIVENQHYRIETEQPIRRIVDGGGNIGLSALWFARTYPEAIIEVFEADPSLAGLCHRNLEAAGVAGARVLTAALWNRDGEIPFAASGDDRGHVSLVSSHARVPCRDIAEVVDSGVDLLKLDIEGAEFECLERLIETRAIRRVRHLVVEIHLSQAVAARAYRVLAALAEEGFATAFEAVIRDWLGPECAPSPFPGVGSGRTFMMLRAWRPGPDRGESESPSGVADTLEADAEFCV